MQKERRNDRELMHAAEPHRHYGRKDTYTFTLNTALEKVKGIKQRKHNCVFHPLTAPRKTDSDRESDIYNNSLEGFNL